MVRTKIKPELALPRDRDFVARRVPNVDDVLGVFFGDLALPLTQGFEVVKDSERHGQPLRGERLRLGAAAGELHFVERRHKVVQLGVRAAKHHWCPAKQ